MSEIENLPKKPAPKRWTDEEEAQLTKAYQSGMNIDEIAAQHDRTEGAITSRLQQLDLILYGPYNSILQEKELAEEKPENQGKSWDEADVELLLEAHNSNPTPEQLKETSQTLGRTPRSLVLKLANLNAIEIKPNPNPNPPPKPPKKVKAQIQKVGQKIGQDKEDKPQRKTRITITPEFQTAQRAVLQGENLLILGSAGTGKSTFLKWLRHKLGETKRYAVLAPTGMAALQVGGQTIHSFFGLKAQLLAGEGDDWRKPRTPKLFQKLDMLVIDEISMVRADIFTAMDRFLRKFGPMPNQPFGGVQVICLGDLFQLPPVVRGDEREFFRSMYPSPFFFGSPAWAAGNFGVVEFTHIFRQAEQPFINLLTKVRFGETDSTLLQNLNARVSPTMPQGAVILAARNSTVDAINERELEALATPAKHYDAKTSGTVDTKSFVTKEELVLKPGARVMFTRNDPNGRWVNGSLGQVITCMERCVEVKLDNGETEIVEPVKWEVTRYTVDEETESPVAAVAGTFTQIPLTLAWALTIHKAQGQTLENCVVDLADGGAFTEGQVYVALSRARTLEGLTLAQPITARDIRTSRDVLSFYNQVFGQRENI